MLPDYSKDKVYVSDIKKVAQWYNILHNLGLLVKEEPEAFAGKEDEQASKTEKAPAVTEKKKKKASPKPKAK